jgi:hypothetical protein
MLISTAATAGGRRPKSQPPEHAATTCATDTPNTPAPTARRTAAHPAPIWATASATGEPAGDNRSMSAPTPASCSSLANPTRIDSACTENRDSQPRTVEAGRPAASQIRRQPTPAARLTNAAQIASTTSTRRPRQNRGSSTCVHPHPPAREQIARRGRIRRTDSSVSRTNRGAPCPHGANRPPHFGHVNPPDTNCRSTPAESTPTLTNGPPPGVFKRPFPAACQRMREGPLAFTITPSLASRPHRDATTTTKPPPASRPHHQRPKIPPQSPPQETLTAPRGARAP